MRGKSARYPTRGRLRGEFDRVFVPKNSHRLLQLLGLERLFQNRDWPLRQNAIEHFAIGVTGNDNDGTIGLFPLNEIVNVIGRTVGKFEIEKDEIEFLFLQRGDRFLDGADDNATEADFLEEEFKQILQTLVIIDNQHGRLSGLLLLEDIFIERVLFNSPTTTDLNGGQLPALHQIINRRKRNSEIFGGFLNGKQVMHGFYSPTCACSRKIYSRFHHYKD
jgi:hypothetical protein